MSAARILIVGGGYVGMYTALGLQKRLSRGAAEITVVEPQSNMTYQPFLPEAAAGSVEPRHVVVPLRKVLRKCNVITGAVTTHRPRQQDRSTVQPGEGEPYDIAYDLLIVCPGSISRLLPIPGLAERGIGFKTIGEAIFLRNHVLSRLDLAASTTDPAQRRRALTFVVRRWRLRRCRGDGRARGHGPLRAALLPNARAGRDALGARSRRRAGSCPRCRCGCRPTPSTG